MANEGTSQPQCPLISQGSTHHPTLNGQESSHQPTPNGQESSHQPTPNESANPSIVAPTPTTTDTMEVDSAATQNRPKRRRSEFWDHFEKIIVDGKVKARCNYCKKDLGGSSNDGTSHLKGHLLICPHKKILEGKTDKGQTFLTAKTLQGKQELGTWSYNVENVRKELAHAIILHEYPLSIVDHIGFRRYSASLQPLFQVPCRNTIKKEILKVYECERSSLLKLIERLEGRVAITSDMWTSSNQKRGYMAVTAHYIDGNWTLHSQILR